MNASTKEHEIAQDFPREAKKAKEKRTNGTDETKRTQDRSNEWQRRAKIPQYGPDEWPAEGQKSITSGPCGPLEIKTDPRERR